MEIFLLFIILILLSIIYYQWRAKRGSSSNLHYISSKLDEIITKDSEEKLLVFTENEELKAILIELNRLLDYNKKVKADYSKTQIAMRKMLSNISHDLKTPLTVVLGYIETLQQYNDMSNDERDELLTKVKSKTSEVLELINEFFHLAKLEAGDKDIPLSRICISEVCRKNILGFYDLLSAKGFEVILTIPEDNLYCLANEEALDRILNNLITNAVNYGYEGHTLGLSLKSDDEFIYIEVWDKGKGIIETQKDCIFERMYTLEDSRNKLYQGSGLGLTITKRLVEKLKGEIILESKPYEKTSFIVKLPRITY